MGEPGGLPSMGSHRVGHDRSDLAAAAGRLSGFNGIPGGSDSKESACNAGDLLWVGKMPWRREWQPTPIFLPGEFHGQGSLVGCGPWGHRVRYDCVTNTHTPTHPPILTHREHQTIASRSNL